MLMLFVAQAAMTVAAPPPRVVSVPPPMIMRSPNGDPGPRTRVAIVLRSPQEIIWQGDLWVGTRGSSSWRESISEAGAEPCNRSWEYGGGQRESSVTLGPQRAEASGEQTLVVTVRWSRPVDEPCSGVRTVELRQPVKLPASGSITIKGDGGLVVEVRRR